jgi:GNAT superfamily N-acetyltransferase
MTIATVTATLREARAEDAARIADIYLASRAAFLPYARSPHSVASVRAWIRDILLPGDDVTVTSVGDAPVGFMAVHRTGGVAWISRLYLDPPLVGRGIGTRLLAHALATASRPVRLLTFQQNAAARLFYGRNGFSPVRFRDGATNEERCPDVLYELAAS